MKTCFFITPLGNETDPERLVANQLMTLITEVLDTYGIELVRADTYSKSGNITSQIVQLIVDSDLAIVDLTGGNSNVFYELGVRHSTGKPVIPIIKNGEGIPFDVGHERAIFYDIEERSQEFKKNLDQTILNLIKFPLDSPNPVSRLDEFIPLQLEHLPSELKLLKLIFKLTKAYQFIGSYPNNRSSLSKSSMHLIKKITPLILDDLNEQMSKLLHGIIETRGEINRDVFEIMMSAVRDNFKAISVNDLDFWLTSEGEHYLESLTNRINPLSISVERIFVLDSYQILLEKPVINNKQQKKTYFDLVLKNQIQKGVKIRIVKSKNFRKMVNSLTDLDFGLFDEFAVSFFRISEGRIHKVNFLNQEIRKYQQLYDKVKIKCEENFNLNHVDNKIFENVDDLVKWKKETLEKEA